MGGPVRHVARLGLAFTLALSAVGLADVRAAQAASPTVLAFLPLSGPVGTSVTITGLGFQDSSPATGVAFNGTAASFTVDSTTQITATVPSGATTGPISVTDSEGTGTTLLDFTVTPWRTERGFQFSP
jgi:IPT/TIG domain